MIVCDTGPLVAADRSDADNRPCTDLFTSLTSRVARYSSPPLSWPRSATSSAAPAARRSRAHFLRSIAQQTISIVDLELSDYERMAELVDAYADFPLGTTDAAVVAVAERLRVSEVATLDHRHFRVVRPRHIPAFTLLP